MFCVNAALGNLVINNSICIDLFFKREASIFDKSDMASACVALVGFTIEVFILYGLILDLYKWWLFIALVNEQDRGQEFDEHNDAKSSLIERNNSSFKIKIY